MSLQRKSIEGRAFRLVAGGMLLTLSALSAGAEPLPTRYFAAKDVADAFARGSVLYDGAGGANFMVHASRRESAGQVEVHTLDTDVIYVLDGSATFVTGGTMVGGKETASHEMRGSQIEGGTTRTISKGDVIIVPKGTPHWFKDVHGPVLYFVVKVQ